MKIKVMLLGLICLSLVSCSFSNDSENSYYVEFVDPVQEDFENESSSYEFSSDELEVLEVIATQFEEFEYTSNYEEAFGIKKMLNKSGENIYRHFISSESIYLTDMKVVNVSFDMGTAYRGVRTYTYINDKTVLMTEKSFGTTNYGYYIYKNGELLEEKSYKY